MKSDSYYKSGEDLTFTPTTHAEEKILFAKAKAGDKAAKEQIIRNHLLFVSNLARSFAGGNLADEDVVSAANFALMSAFENFNPELNNRFSSFLTLYVRGAIARLWREKNVVSKGDFSDGEPIVSVPINEETADEANSDGEEHKEFLLKLVEQAKLVLDPREKEIIKLLYCEIPASQAEVARKLGLSRERIRQIYDVALHKLQKQLRILMNAAGINQ